MRKGEEGRKIPQNSCNSLAVYAIKEPQSQLKFNCSVDSNWIFFPQVIVTAKFWFVSDLTGGQANAEAQAAKYHHCHHHYYRHCYHHYYHYCCNIHRYYQIIALSI